VRYTESNRISDALLRYGGSKLATYPGEQSAQRNTPAIESSYLTPGRALSLAFIPARPDVIGVILSNTLVLAVRLGWIFPTSLSPRLGSSSDSSQPHSAPLDKSHDSTLTEESHCLLACISQCHPDYLPKQDTTYLGLTGHYVDNSHVTTELMSV
jgi:hypothetical protein